MGESTRKACRERVVAGIWQGRLWMKRGIEAMDVEASERLSWRWMAERTREEKWDYN